MCTEEQSLNQQGINEIHQLIRERIAPHYRQFASCRSSAELHRLDEYRSVEHDIRRVLETPEIGNFTLKEAPARNRYRFLAWNVERGIQFEEQLRQLRTHSYLKTCDVLLLTETDVGMVRSGNRAVARELARELDLYYAFVPCYLNLTKGSGVEFNIPGENELGLHGNAILSRYPISQVRPIYLKNGIDKVASREKRIGCQAAVSAKVRFPNFSVTAVSLHLGAQSSQRHRYLQMRDVINGVAGAEVVVVGGDWNTSTYNSSHALHSFLGFCRRVMMGVDNAIRNHYLHPYRRFERDLFKLLEDHGFDYRRSNVLGEHTVAYCVDDARSTGALRDWVPGASIAVLRWALRNHDGRCPLKLDWFATRGVRCANPVIIHEVRDGRAIPLSDHDAIGLDIGD
jgi:endonuclease/exonuclease/phosphatase family metal-dependent hydrolase